MKATIAIGLKDAGMDVKFEFDLSDAADAGRFKALGTLLAKHGAGASTRERFFPLVIDNLDAIVSGTRVTVAGDATNSTKSIIAPQPARAGFKNALDVAIEKANAHGTPVPRQTTVTQRPVTPGNRVWPALDLSETMDSRGTIGVAKKRDNKKS